MKSFYVFGNINPLGRNLLSELGNELVLKKQFAQKSIIVYGEKGIDLDKNQVILNGDWREKQAYDELTKNYRNEIINDPADYIIIDALGSVIPIYYSVLNNEKYRVTYSKNVKKVVENLNVFNKLVYTLDDKPTRGRIIHKIMSFCKDLTNVYEQNHIIVHEANYPKLYFCEGKVLEYSDKTLNNRRDNEELLMLIYDCMREYMPAAHYIRMLPNVYALSEARYSDYDQSYMQYLAASVLIYIDPQLAQNYIKSIFLK